MLRSIVLQRDTSGRGLSARPQKCSWLVSVMRSRACWHGQEKRSWSCGVERVVGMRWSSGHWLHWRTTGPKWSWERARFFHIMRVDRQIVDDLVADDEPRKRRGASPASSIVAPCCRGEVSLSRAYQEGDARMTSAATVPTSPSTTPATPTTTPCTSIQGHAAPEVALDAMSQYMSDMRGIAPLADGEERRLLDAIHAGDTAARERLVLAFQPWLLSLARRYAAGSEHLTLLDYVQEGNVGLLESIARHADSATFTKPVAFRTWAYWWVRGQMRQAFWRFEGRGALPERQARSVATADGGAAGSARRPWGVSQRLRSWRSDCNSPCARSCNCFSYSRSRS